jgi:hypothetical protein
MAPNVERVTEWPLSTTPFGYILTLSVAKVLLPFFSRKKIRDSSGVTAETLVYKNGKTRSGTRGRRNYGTNPITGVFAFRYAVFDQTSGRWVNGPSSEYVYAFPARYPVWTYPVDFNFGTPQTSVVQNQLRDFLQLKASVGSQIR